jgi:hypothetical protein
LGIWLASSFAYYLYVDPSFAHTHAAFLTALFVWLWEETRGRRSWQQWLGLGVIGGLLMDTYYPGALVLLLPVWESMGGYWKAVSARSGAEFAKIAVNNAIFAVAALVLFFPSLVVKRILWGSYFQMGYKQHWYWFSPYFLRVCFSSHGAFSWTPILSPAVVGIFLLRKSDRMLSNALLATLLGFIYFIGCYQDWHAIPSFGNRFFVSFTVFFIIGLGVLMNELERVRYKRGALVSVLAATCLLIVWNCGVIYQFVAHLFPQTGEVSWSQVAYNQVAVVPGEVSHLIRVSVDRRLGVKASEEKQPGPPTSPASEAAQ